MTDNAWDEQIVNNIQIKKVHIISEKDDQEGAEWRRDEINEILPISVPIKIWDYSSELEIYTRAVVAKEKGR